MKGEEGMGGGGREKEKAEEMEAQEKEDQRRREWKQAKLSHKGVRMPWAQALTAVWDSKL